MPTKEHRLGVSEANLVKRRIKIEPSQRTNLRPAIEEIDQIFGLESVSFNERKHVLETAYDATRVGIDSILEILVKHGVEVSHDWWARVKTGYYRSVDGNIQDKANREPLSCHPPPQATRKR